MTNEEIANSLQAVLYGGTSTVLREGDEEIPITGRAEAAERLAADRIATANVFSPTSGVTVPLIQIATLRPETELGLERPLLLEPAERVLFLLQVQFLGDGCLRY